ncbi:uncharacterized protein RSE6_13256 [Rhynchosporium secalis]|uniref:Uncharacterized protein n=1 Tax=Rhynchosporium secalis TaxID=38038 RepID=A0A1E1MSG5_RHYSE|nr:uncharacterized protein RSE6_13256 [Rhynchosporium secalis]
MMDTASVDAGVGEWEVSADYSVAGYSGCFLCARLCAFAYRGTRSPIQICARGQGPFIQHDNIHNSLITPKALKYNRGYSEPTTTIASILIAYGLAPPVATYSNIPTGFTALQSYTKAYGYTLRQRDIRLFRALFVYDCVGKYDLKGKQLVVVYYSDSTIDATIASETLIKRGVISGIEVYTQDTEGKDDFDYFA